MTYSSTITSKGTITLPSDIRKSLGFKPGDRVIIEQKSGSVSVKPDTYKEELDQLRSEIEKDLKAKGKWGVSFEEARKIAEQEKVKEYRKKHGVRT